jgi:hypothetical protein
MGDARGASSGAPAAAATASSAAATTVQTAGEDREGAPNTEARPTLNQIRYACLMNMDYHGTREARLDRLHRWLMFGVIAAGAAALVDAMPQMRLVGGVIAAIFGALDLTFDLSNRARSHAMFRRRYGEIMSQASRAPDELQNFQCKLDELSGEEEPPFHAQLALSAMKAQQATYGRITDPCRPAWGYRSLANVFRFDGRDFNEPSPAD